MGDNFEAEGLAMLPDAVVLARHVPETNELRVVFVNAAGQRLLGARAAEALGQPLRTLLADESLFQRRDQREAFHGEVQRLELLEFPGLTPVRDAVGRRRELRIRMCWPRGSDTAMVIAEDTTERSMLAEHSGAAERLRSAVEVSGLLSHHVNNALAAALLNVEYVQRLVAGGRTDGAAEALASTRKSLEATADVVAALGAGVGLDTSVEESCDLVAALRCAGTAVGGSKLELDAAADPSYVWGADAQIQVVLSGLIPVLSAEPGSELRAAISRSGNEVVLELSAEAPAEQWWRALLDPAEPQPASDARSVRLFASMQVLRVVGGRLGLPSWHDGRLRALLHFRAAPGPVRAPEERTHVLLISGDGALRAAAASHLADCAVEHSLSIRDGIRLLMRPHGGIVICDVDELQMPLQELVALQRMATGGDTRRLILCSRKSPPDASLHVPQLGIPFARSELRDLVKEARSSELR